MSLINRVESTVHRIIRLTSLEAISRLPSPIFSHVGEKTINRFLGPLVRDGQLKPLEGKCWKIEISDASRTVFIRLNAGHFSVTDRETDWDVCFKAPLATFLVLALKEEDPDTLFFNRRLSISGDTEIGLAIKNFIDSVEVEEVLKPPLSLLVKNMNQAFTESGTQRV